MEKLDNEKSKLVKMGVLLVVILSLYFLVKTFSEIKSYSFIGGGATATNTISFSGTGDVMAKPDLATINFTIIEEAKTSKDALTKMTAKETAVLAFLDKSGIEKKDIKAENYNSSPKWEYRNAVCPQYAPAAIDERSADGSVSSGSAIYCPPGKSVLTGYEVSEYISVKIRDLTKTGDIAKGISDVGISNVNGPNYSIDKEDTLKGQARKIAIEDAKGKAKTLAADLGVKLIRIVNFSENGYSPIMYANKGVAYDSLQSAVAPSPELPTGENKITSNVTITYEIR